MSGKKKYTIGIDFGSESVRAVLADTSNGNLAASSIYYYTHGIITKTLPESEVELEPGTALQHPKDYINALKRTIPKLLIESQVDPTQIIGIGVDFVGSTVIPTKSDGTPLALLDEYKDNPHAWPKFWKQHGAEEQAKKITQLAVDRFETFLDRYGGKIDPEWFFPKVWEIYDESANIYHDADRLIEASDWIIWQLTGVESRNICAAGYKALWSKNEGFPLETFFSALDPELANVVEEKMSLEITPLGEQVGELTEEAAKWMKLQPGIPIAAGILDKHAAVPGAGVAEPGKMAMIMDENFTHMILSKKEFRVPGMCGMVEDGIIPGLIAYEASQTSGGDLFNWFFANSIPAENEKEAKKQNISIKEFMMRKAAELEPAESGLVVLDWWNGNRSILVDNDLRGLILGYSLETKPEEIYRAILEAAAYGTRKIFETFIASGVPINEIVVTGGNPNSNPLLLEILANVTRTEIKVAACPYTSALGSAMYAAVAAGEYKTIEEASSKMAHLESKTYAPNNNDKKTYNRLYSEYTLLHDYFGYGHNNAMKRLKHLRDGILEKKNG